MYYLPYIWTRVHFTSYFPLKKIPNFCRCLSSLKHICHPRVPVFPLTELYHQHADLMLTNRLKYNVQINKGKGYAQEIPTTALAPLTQVNFQMVES